MTSEGGSFDRGADLHIHSHHSDGRASPEWIMERAAGSLGLISICDHDTVNAYDGLPERDDIQVLRGIEISTVLEGEGLHILGYFPAGFTDAFRERVRTFEEERRARVRAGVRKLRELGIPLRWELLDRCVGPGVPCRSHVARALVELGVARSPHGTYERYLTTERFPPPRLDARDAIALIRAEGGVAIWAHPDTRHLAPIGSLLVEAELDGIELHGRGRRRQRHHVLEEFRAAHDLIATGGSDYHGESRRSQLGRFRIPLEIVPSVLLPPSTDPGP